MAIDLFSIGPLTIHGYGLMIGIGFLFAILVGCKVAKQSGLSDDLFTNIAIFVLIIGFMGGKLMYTIVNFKAFLQNPMRVLSSEGFVVYGGIITGVLTIIVYCKIKKISVMKYLDLITAVCGLAQGFGRIGCFLAGCCYGRRTDAWYGVIFPEGCLAPAGVKLVPTQLIMALGDFIIFAVLLFIYFKRKNPGIVCGFYLLFYSIGRFLIEIIRDDDERGYIGALSTSQFIAIWIAIGAIIYILIVRKYGEKNVESLEEDASKEEKASGEGSSEKEKTSEVEETAEEDASKEEKASGEGSSEKEKTSETEETAEEDSKEETAEEDSSIDESEENNAE